MFENKYARSFKSKYTLNILRRDESEWPLANWTV